MSGTTTQPNNVAVKFRGKAEHEKRRKVVPGAKKAAKRGLISEKQMKRLHDGE